MKSFLPFLIVAQILLFATTVPAQGTAVYLHPISTIVTVTGINSFFPNALYVSAEFPLSQSTHVWIQPTVWNGSIHREGRQTTKMKIDLFQIGTKVGISHYFNDNADGFFLRGAGLIDYCKGSAVDGSDSGSGKSMEYAAIGYVGFKTNVKQVHLMLDLGGGPVWNALDIANEAGSSLYGNFPFVIDLNIGIGFQL